MRCRYIGAAPLRRALRLLALLLFLLAAGTGPAFAQPAAEDYVDDFSGLGWTQAFDAMHETMQRKYAFGAWKHVPWSALAESERPKIVKAEQQHDAALYYQALREYLLAIPDGHLGVGSDPGNPVPEALRHAAIGAGYGMTLAQLDDGSVVVDYVAPEGPAAKAGIRAGATLLRCNGMTLSRALANVSLLWANPIPSTPIVRRLQQLRFLLRAPADTRLSLRVRNPGRILPRETVLRAVEDDYATLDRTRLVQPVATVQDEPIAFRILRDNVGYLNIRVLMDEDGHTFADLLERAWIEFHAAGVRGVVIDLRGDPGGQDEYAALVGGYFHAQESVYEQVAAYAVDTGTLTLIPALTLAVTPQPIVYTGPVVALVDAGTSSSAEGVALLVERRVRGAVVGRAGTNGSFGITGGSIAMPDGFSILYPPGQSLDANGRIQLDSNERGEGGVRVAVRVPYGRRELARQQRGNDVLLEAAVAALRFL